MNNNLDHISEIHDSDLDDLIMDPEKDNGNREYKYTLTNLTDLQFDHLVVQLRYRMEEGNGEAIYDIGIRDDGYPIGLTTPRMEESLENLRKMADQIPAKICYVNRRFVSLNELSSIVSKKVLKEGQVRRIRGFNLEKAENKSSSDTHTKKSSHSRASRVTALVDDGDDETANNNIVNSVSGANAENSNVKTREIAEVLIREVNFMGGYIDLRVAVAGNVDSSKSSTVGVLIKGNLDNGRGSARLNVFNHKHEITTGRTSSISQQIMGFDSEGAVVNEKYKIKAPTWQEIVEQSSKIITFFDLAGHERYLKTTITGLSANHPDYCMLMVGANMGITHITREHMILCLSMKVPFYIVMSKIDIAPSHILEQTYEQICKLLKLPGIRRIPFLVKSIDDVILCSKNIVCDNVVPIFQISNVTGHNLSLLRLFLNCLPASKDVAVLRKEKVRYQIHDVFSVTGVGTVVSGLLTHGTVAVGDKLMLGPDKSNAFTEVIIKSIQCKRVTISEIHAGYSVCFGLKKVARTDIKRGMVLLDPALNPEPVWEFDADIMILNAHSTMIRRGYQPVIHINNVRQAATIISIIDVTTPVPKTQDGANTAASTATTTEFDTGGFSSRKITTSATATASTSTTTSTGNFPTGKSASSDFTGTTSTDATDCSANPAQLNNPRVKLQSLKTGDRAKVHFRFGFHPEWIESGSRLIFREGKTKGFGIISKIYDYDSTRAGIDTSTESRVQRRLRKQAQMTTN